MENDKDMSHEGMTKDQNVEEQHLDAVLANFEVELRMLEKWLENPKTDEEVAKENESKREI